MAFATPDDSVENDLNSNGVVENSEDAVFATTMVTTEANNFGIHPRGLHNSGGKIMDLIFISIEVFSVF